MGPLQPTAGRDLDPWTDWEQVEVAALSPLEAKAVWPFSTSRRGVVS